MFGYDCKVLLRDLLINVGKKELEIEKCRQQLCSIYDFDPFIAYKRLCYTEDDNSNIDRQSMLLFMK